ncbi:hypothetical protein HID58_094558 [Brassica napus]|uniref:Uncharacterized protein n=1 Tax=Brassica napus TaxID=3708 RepID=A0ABQ7X6T9_BRANA|nr:hypothetical protein HID58_094558 [Brassica napus]
MLSLPSFTSSRKGYGREPRFFLAAGINPKMVAGKLYLPGKLYLNGTYAARIYFDYETAVGKAEIDRQDILLCKLILSFSPVNHPCPRRVDGISIDPEPNWNFDSLLSEIESVEKKLNVFSKFPQPFTQTTLRYISLSLSFDSVMGRRGGGFVMRVSEDEMESDVDEESDEEEEEKDSQICTKGKHFACDELYLR